MTQTEFEQALILIQQGALPEAIQLVSRHCTEGIMIQSRYENGKKQYDLGLIDMREWKEIRDKIADVLRDIVMQFAQPVKQPASLPSPQTSESISLLDHFAGLAMQAILSTRSGIVDAQEIAEMAYRQATAMLIEREKQTKE